MNMLTRVVAALSLSVVVGSLGGCGSSDTKPSSTSGTQSSDRKLTPNSDRSRPEFRIFPDKIYSGFNASNPDPYLAPVIAVNSQTGKVTWSVADESIAKIESLDGVNATLKMLKPGTTKVTAKSGTDPDSTVDLEVIAYTDAQVKSGKDRWFKDGDSCEPCHAVGTALNNTPTELDADDDEDIKTTFLTGNDPEGRPIDSPNHKYAMTADEASGIVSYMRSLKPKGYPSPDHEEFMGK